MDRPKLLTVRLYKSGRYFFCHHCQRSHRHPPDNPDLYVIGYGVCELYASWMPIEGGDRLGIVRMDADGKLYTVERGAE